MAMTIERATPPDVPELMRLERGTGFEHLVGRWSAAQHAAEMAKSGSHYLSARSEAGLAGFVLLQDLDDPNGCATLRRIAVARPGEGLGARLLEAALAHAFRERLVHRVQLRVYPENHRARRAYERIGFEAEGLMRDCSLQGDGSYRSMTLMAILQPYWRARRG